MNKTIIVWITNPAACDNIVKAGKRIADELEAELMITSIQKTIRNDWDTAVNDLEALNNASRGVNAELTVIYSDNTFESAVKTVSKLSPCAMVTGLPGNINKETFLDHIKSLDPNIPIYTVDVKGNAIKLS